MKLWKIENMLILCLLLYIKRGVNSSKFDVVEPPLVADLELPSTMSSTLWSPPFILFPQDLRSLEKWTMKQVPTKARGQLPFDIFQTVLHSIINPLFHKRTIQGHEGWNPNEKLLPSAKGKKNIYIYFINNTLVYSSDRKSVV